MAIINTIIGDFKRVYGNNNINNIFFNNALDCFKRNLISWRDARHREIDSWLVGRTVALEAEYDAFRALEQAQYENALNSLEHLCFLAKDFNYDTRNGTVEFVHQAVNAVLLDCSLDDGADLNQVLGFQVTLACQV